MKTLKNHREKMSVRVNVRKSKIMRTSVKVSVLTYATYVNCRTLMSVDVRVHVRGKKSSFFGKFGVLCLLEKSVLRFAILPYRRQYLLIHKNSVFLKI